MRLTGVGNKYVTICTASVDFAVSVWWVAVVWTCEDDALSSENVGNAVVKSLEVLCCCSLRVKHGVYWYAIIQEVKGEDSYFKK
jgi:hypothetical protein